MGKRIVTAVKQRFSIRKLSIGAASVLLGTSLYFMGGSATIVHADTNVSGGTPQTETSKDVQVEPASGQTGEENGSTEVKDPVKVAKDPTKDDTDVNQAIDDYANQKQEEQDKAGNKVIIRPSGKQPVKTADTADERGKQVEDIKHSIDDGIAAANKDKKAIEDYKNKHQNQQILNGEESEAFKNQGLSVDDERNSEINKVTITDTKDKTKTKEVNTTVIDGPSQKIEIDGKKDAIVITHAGPDKMTDKEKDIMQIKSDNKVIIDLNDKYQNKDITVTYSNLNNSYYLENMGDETDRIKISRIERTFSGIQATDDPKLFNPNGSDSYKKDGIYDKCDGPQLIIYKDPSDGFFYNNIKQVSVKDIYYDDKNNLITFKDGDKNKAWIFVTSLNSDGVGNNNHRGDGKEYLEKVKAENPDGTSADIEKLAGSTVTGPVDENTTKEFTRTVELFDGASSGDYLRNYLRDKADDLKNKGWIRKENSSELTQTVTLHVKKTNDGYVYDNENENAFFKGLKLPSISENGTEKYPDIEIPEVRVGTKTAVRIRVSYSANNPHTPTPLDKTEVGVDEDKATDTHDGWWYSDESNSHDQNNYPDWDNKSEDNRYAFVGAVAIQYQPGMTITYGADDTAWGSHWACAGTQVVSTLNERVIIYDHIKDGVVPVTPKTPPTDIPTNTVKEAQPDQLTKTVNLTVNYVNSDGADFTGKVPANYNQTVTFTGTAYVDKVTGKLVNAQKQADGTWVVDDRKTDKPQVIWKADGKDSFDEVISPVENDYHLTGIDRHRKGNNVEEITGLTQDSGSITVTVTYTKNGKIIPVDKDGNPITGADQPVFPTDPNDPSRVDSGKIPDLSDKGYHPFDIKPDGTVDPDSEDPSKDITVKYVKSGTISVKYHDNTEDKDIDGYGKNDSGNEDAPFNYDPTSDLAELKGKGYVLDGKEPEIPRQFTASAKEVIINLKHGTTTVTSNNPGHPGEPVDPKNSEGPKYPNGTKLDQVKRTGTQTIHYVGAGDKTPADNKQTFIFTREITFDNVTGKIINVTPWNVESHTFGNVDTPVIPGYHADKDVAGGETVTPDDLNKVITVTYAPDGNPGNPSDHGDTPSPEPTPEPEPTPNPTPDDQPDSETSSDEHFEKVKAKDKLDKTNPKKVAAYKKERKIIKTKIAKQGHTEIAEPIEDKVTRENNVKVVSDPVENKAAEPKLPQTGEADNSIIGLLGMLLASFAAMFGFDSLHSHDKKHKN